MTNSRVLSFFLIVISAAWLGTPGAAHAPALSYSTENAGGECTLRIHVDGLRNSKGVVGSILYKSADGWPEDPAKAFRRGPTDIPSGMREATVVWEHLPPGEFGVAVIHDENRNAKLDRNFFGIPKEGFGFANNPHVTLGPPSFDKAIVHMKCPVTEISIHVKYK
jgi:uncharacterized protein (DUF2141 family)